MQTRKKKRREDDKNNQKENLRRKTCCKKKTDQETNMTISIIVMMMMTTPSLGCLKFGHQPTQLEVGSQSVLLRHQARHSATTNTDVGQLIKKTPKGKPTAAATPATMQYKLRKNNCSNNLTLKKIPHLRLNDYGGEPITIIIITRHT